LLLTLAVLPTGCASLPPPPDQGTNWRYTPREAAAPTLAQRPQETVMVAGTARAAGTADGALPRAASETARRSVTATHLAFLRALGDASDTTRRLSGELSRLKVSQRGIAGRVSGIFVRYVDHGVEQLRWMEAELAAITRLSDTASQVDDPDMQLALLRLGGPRLEAAMMGSLLLAVWVDFLHLADVLLSQHLYGVERLLVDLERWWMMLQPSMTALSSLEPGQVEAAATDMPALVGHLTSEFAATQETVRVGAENYEKVMVLKEAIEALTLLSSMKVALPRLRPPAAPLTLGVGWVMGNNGVMMGTRVVVSAEWVEMMRRLVRAGVLSLPAVSAAVRIHAGQVMMAEAHDELPRGVREALGDGPEVRGMRVTGRAGAGMAEPPEHHVLPREFREWFEKRGFTGEMSIDRFCVRMEQASHEAIHGGGDWRLGRQWPGEWNQMIMKALQRAESRAGRMLTPGEILKVVAYRMRLYKLPMDFTPGRGQ
jgi:hypothetical protein